MTASPGTINSGQTSTLSWTTTNATSAQIDNGVGTVQVPSGSTTVSPTQTTTYTEIRAIDHLTMQFPALTQTITASLDHDVHADAVPYATGALTLPARTWDSGNDDLPGPQ